MSWIDTPHKVHVIGIGGAGMNGIAMILRHMGHRVSGSDAAASVVTERMERHGIAVQIGADAQHVAPDTEIVIHSTAIPVTHPERVAAGELAIPDLTRADALAQIARRKPTLAVAGTHGKTTTTTMLSHALADTPQGCSWLIGGDVAGRDGGAEWNDGEFFVVEADESDGTFLDLSAYGVIVTTLEPDHLEFYGSLNDPQGAFVAMREAFVRFVSEAAGPRVICADNEGARSLATLPGVVTYGEAEQADYRVDDVQLERFSSRFTVLHRGCASTITIAIPGRHNVLNATAAFALGCELGIKPELLVAGLATFRGVGRRFDVRGEQKGVTYVDEYAHLPGEVKAALAAARAGDWPRIVAVFQPHRYSRTAQVGNDFGGAFDDADLLVLTGIYSAGEPARPGVDGHLVRRAVEAEVGHPPLVYVEERTAVAEVVADLLRPGDLCITLGAGDIGKLAGELLSQS